MAVPERVNIKKLPSEEVLAAGGKVIELASGEPPAPGSPEAMAIAQRIRESTSKRGGFRIGKVTSALAQDPSERFDGRSS